MRLQNKYLSREKEVPRLESDGMSFHPFERNMEANAQPSHVHVSHELSVEQSQCKMQQKLHFLIEVVQKCKPRCFSHRNLPDIQHQQH